MKRTLTGRGVLVWLALFSKTDGHWIRSAGVSPNPQRNDTTDPIAPAYPNHHTGPILVVTSDPNPITVINADKKTGFHVCFSE